MYQEFRRCFQAYSVITLPDIQKSFPDFDSKNLINWQKKGYVLKLRNGHYLLSETKLTEDSMFQIANRLYEPSYVSLESALGFHGIIPEAVYSIQSVSTRKTNLFSTPVGTFHYRTLKKELFFGYRLVRNESATFRMASMEKAILDFLYLRSDIDDLTALEALRWNPENLEQIDDGRLQDYLKLFDSAVLRKKIDHLNSYRHAGHR